MALVARFHTADANGKAMIDNFRTLHGRPCPVLVGNRSVETSEHLGRLLRRQGLAHIVPVSGFGRIEPGMRAAVQSLPPGTEASVATVTIVDRVVDAASGAFGARLALPDPQHRLPGGLKCDIRIFEGGSWLGRTSYGTDPDQ